MPNLGCCQDIKLQQLTPNNQQAYVGSTLKSSWVGICARLRVRVRVRVRVLACVRARARVRLSTRFWFSALSQLWRHWK